MFKAHMLSYFIYNQFWLNHLMDYHHKKVTSQKLKNWNINDSQASHCNLECSSCIGLTHVITTCLVFKWTLKQI
jgi:hypothetical protein